MDAQEFRRVGHDMIDLIADYLDGAADLPLFPRVEPEEVDGLFDEALPEAPRPLDEVLARLRRDLLPHCVHVNHPGYYGLITPSPSPAGILGDLLASALNQNVGSWTIGPSAVAIERRVVRWLCELVGWDETAAGHLTSGGTMANLEGLKLARDAVTGDEAQHQGLRGEWAVYTSRERHVSVDKAVDIVGVGRARLRVLPTDDHFRLSLDALEAALEADAREGVRPLCLVAMAGATNTGAVDDLAALRQVADRTGAWLHADAAYGGGMLLSRRHPGLLRGLELVDSVTIDPHKWFYAPLDAGAILVRDARRLTASYGMRPSYLTDEMDEEQRRFQYYVHSLEQSRRFRGLKVWMGFQRYGREVLGGWVDDNVDQARRLYELVVAHPRFVAACEPGMSVLCLRHVVEGQSAEEAARLHRRVARAMEQEGRFWISTAELGGELWFRVCPVNIRTTLADMDALMASLARHCEEQLAAP